MKKLNKLFGLMLIAGCSMSLASNVNAAEVCSAGTETQFKECLTDPYSRVIAVNASYSLTGDVTVNDKRIVIEDNNTLTIEGNLKLENFTVRTADNDTYVTGRATNKSINVLLNGTNPKLVVHGTLTASSSDKGAIAIASPDQLNPSGFGGTIEVSGKVNVSGYGHTAIRSTNVIMTGNANVEVFNSGNAFNIKNLTISGNAVLNSHDNERGLTAAITASDNAQINVTDNKYSGVYSTGTVSDNAKIVSSGNATEESPDGLYYGDVAPSSATGLTFKDDATLEAGIVADPYHSNSDSANKVVVEGDKVTLKVDKFSRGTFAAPETGLTGVVRVGNWVHVYSLEGDTVEITLDDTVVGVPGIVGVANHTDKVIKVTTPDSSKSQEVEAGGSNTFTLIKITAKIDEKVSEGEVVVFVDTKFSELSDEGMAKLDEMLAKEGQHINNYVVDEGEALTGDYKFTVDTELHATYYIVLTIGNYEFWVNPGTKLSDLSKADQAKLEAIKTASTKKFMYFAVDGKAISETDTVFNKDTTILVLYEGDAAPVVPDTPENPEEPSKPDDGTGSEREPEAGEKLPENQPTGDNVMGSVAMGIAGLVGIVGSALVFDKKTNYNN